MTLPALAALFSLLLFSVVIARWPHTPELGRVIRLLEGPLAPSVAGLISALTVGYIWGSLDPAPIYHDEAAYLLQAQLFAHGVIAGAPAPLPKFFEQFHVLVSSVLAPKYPPGFALAMVPGIWFGVPVLMPLLFTALTGGLLFLLARKLAGGPTALLATAIWTVAPVNLLLHASYFSQTLSAALWLLGWWALLRWREGHRTSYLVLLGVVVGWLAITRPFTALLYALPVGVVVLRDVVTHRLWRGFAIATAAGAVCFLLLPIQNRVVTGHWLEMPYSRYTVSHLPFDRMGFGLRASEPTVPLPPDMVAFTHYFEAIHQAHTLARLPATLAERTTSVLAGLSNGAPLLLCLLILLGLFRAQASVLFAAVSAALLLIGHLAYAHPPEWILYYEEGFSVLALLGALGMSRLVDRTLALAATPDTRSTLGTRRVIVLMAAALGTALLLPSRLTRFHAIVQNIGYDQAVFHDKVRALPTRSIVFVRYGPNHNMHFSLIANPPDYQSAKAWIVYDRGDDDRRLMAIAPDRVPYLYVEEERRLAPMVAGAPNGD